MAHSNTDGLQLVLGSIYLAVITSQICGILIVYKRRKEMYIEKRYPSLTIAYNISTLITMLSCQVCEIAAAYLKSPRFKLIIFIASIVSILTTLYFVNVKNWMIFYKYHWQYYVLQNKWHSIITDKNNNNNFFIKYNETWGNLSIVWKRFAIIHFIGISLLVTLLSFNILTGNDPDLPPTYLRIPLLICIIIILCLFAIYYLIISKIPSFPDKWYIHKESRISSISLTIGFILVIIVASMTANFYGKNNEQLGTTFSKITWILLSYLWGFMGFIATWYVIIKNGHHYEQVPISTNNDHTLNTRERAINQLKKILSNELRLNSFVTHLSEEYCLEILLSYIEFTQFQKFLISKNKVDQDCNNEEIINTIFADSVPLSNLLQENNDIRNGRSHTMDLNGDEDGIEIVTTSDNDDIEDLKDFKQRVHDLWNKYISESSPNEINICGEDRRKLKQSLGDPYILITNLEIGYNQLFELIELCRIEMENLLLQSIVRFLENDNTNIDLNV